MSFHRATFEMLRTKPCVSAQNTVAVDHVEKHLGFKLPASVREWYCGEEAIEILERHSNDDHAIPLDEWEVIEWQGQRLLPFKWENQGVCSWSIALDDSDDPPVFVDVDTDGKHWQQQAPTFSAYMNVCVWDYTAVFHMASLVQAQNEPLSNDAIEVLTRISTPLSKTFGWPGQTQHRFASKDHTILIWAGEDQADWFVGSLDEGSLESALRRVWNLDNLGASLYGCSDSAERVLTKIRAATPNSGGNP